MHCNSLQCIAIHYNSYQLKKYNDNPTNIVYSNINHKNVQHVQTTYDSLYRLADYELQLKYDLEELCRTNDSKSANSHKGELIIAYNTKVGYKTLHPKVFYALYIRPNDVDNRDLIYIDYPQIRY